MAARKTKETDIVGKAAKLADLVNYQEESIVSKEIVRGKTGTVTCFAFDKWQGLSEHTAPFNALVYIVDGKAEVKIAGKTSVLDTGDAVIFPAGKPHSLMAVERFKMLLVMIRS